MSSLEPRRGEGRWWEELSPQPPSPPGPYAYPSLDRALARMTWEARRLAPLPYRRAPRRPDLLRLYWTLLEAYWRWLFTWLRVLWGRHAMPREAIARLLRQFARRSHCWPGLPVRELRAGLRLRGHPARVPRHAEWVEALLRLLGALQPAELATFLVALCSHTPPRRLRRLFQRTWRRLRPARVSLSPHA